jgi:hypothetical protein
MHFLFSIKYRMDTCEVTHSYIIFYTLNFFYFPHTICGTPCQNFVCFCICFIYLTNYLYFNNFLNQVKFELQVIQIIK